MGTEIVTLRAAGGEFSGWSQVEITASIDEAARGFSLKTTERPGQFAFPPGTPIELFATGTLACAGYVNEYVPSGSATTHEISVNGRGKGQDFVDCAAIHEKGYAKGKTPADFAKELDRFGVGITAPVPLKPVDMQQIAQGETCFDCLERYMRPAGVTAMGKPDGSIEITNASVARRAAGEIKESDCLNWRAHLSDANRHSDYIVKAQNRTGTLEKDLRIKETAQDSGVGRYRPRMIVLETDGDQDRARERATHEKERCAGLSIRATVTVQGWRDAAGALWEPNTIVFLNSPILMHIVQDMLIEKVSLRQDEGNEGTTATLDLVDPRSYRGKGQDGKQTDPAVNKGW